MDVYKVINAVHKDLASVGIAKNNRNAFDGYQYRGIDAVYNTVSPILAKHGLLILQRVLNCATTEKTSAKGGVLYFSVVDVEFDLVSSHDGSKHTIKTYGEGMDRSDKSINKALTAAYKYALFQCFCIPVEGSDADGDSHTVEPTKPKPQPKPQPKAQAPVLREMPAEMFAQNSPRWIAEIAAGKPLVEITKAATGHGLRFNKEQLETLVNVRVEEAV